MLRENLSINVTPGGVPVIIHISQYDIGLRTFVFSPYTSHGTFTPDAAAAATLEGTKPDGNIIIHNCEYNASTGEITYTVQEQLAAVPGKVWSKLTIRDTSGGVIGYAAIIWMVDMAGVEDGAIASDSDISALQEFIAEFGTINAYKAALDGALAAVGGPYVASTVSQMTDHTKVYVYTGSQTGYTAGHWYYWNGSAWTDGGVYQAAAVETDKTLTVADMAADAKATGDAVAELKNELGITNENSDSPASDWEQGIFQVSNGTKTDITTRLRTASDAGIDSAVQTATCKTGYQIMLFAWNANGYLGIYEGSSFIKANANWQTTVDLAGARNAGATILKIQMRKTDNATIDASYGTNVVYTIINNVTDDRISSLENETQALTSRVSEAEANIAEISADVATMETSVDGIETILAYNRTEGGAPVSDWEQGALQVSNGTDVTNANRIRTVVTGISNDVTSVTCASGFSGFLCCWSDGTYLGIYEGGSFIKQNVSWLTAWNLKAVRNAGADLVRLVIRKNINQAILPEEGTNITYITETSSIDSLSDRLNVFENYMTEPYNGKKISILGDSISTFGGSVSDPTDARFSPEGNPYTYPGNRCRYPQTSLGVTQVTQTYWMRLIMALGMELGINDSWASSRTSWDGTTESTDIGADKYIASTTRIGHLDDNGTPDYILVNAGTNDIINNVTIGTIDDTDPSLITDFDNLPVSTFADAYRTLLCRLMHSYPLARIVCLLPNFATGYGSKKQDTYCEIIKELCDMYGIPYLDMRVNGVTPFNKSTYLGDGVHYNADGMMLVANELIRQFMTLI